jgi:replicative DNA helicase
MKQPEKIVPYDHELEKTILGHCIINNEILLYCVSIIDDSYFSHPFYKSVWIAVEELHKEGIEPDIISVRQRTAQIERDMPQNIALKLSELTKGLQFPNIESWVSLAKNLRDARVFIDLCQKYALEAYTGNISDVMDEFHMKFIEIGSTRSGMMIMDTGKRIDNAVAKIAKGLNSDGVSGISTGLTSIDYVMGGLQTGLHVFAGRPGTGKSEISMFIAQNAEKQSAGYIAQLEMSADQTTYRQLTTNSGIRYSKMQRSQLSDGEFNTVLNAAQKAKASNLYIDPTAGMSAHQIIAKIKYHKKRFSIGWAMVDYLQIMSTEQNKNQTRDQALGFITRSLKAIANELDIPIILLAQVGKSADSRPFGRPTASDLRESGNIEADADTVVLLYYAEKFRGQYSEFIDPINKQPLDGIIEFIFAKNRSGTPNISAFAHWESGKIEYRDADLLNTHLYTRVQTPTQQNDIF